MKTIFFLFLATAILGCSSQKLDYKLMDVVFNDVQQNGDTIDIVNYSKRINPDFFDTYKNHKQIFFSKGIFPSEGKFRWIDNSNSWILTEEDVCFLIESLKKQRERKWETHKFKSNKTINLFKSPIVNESHDVIDNERIRRVKLKRHLYLFSLPIFNESEDIGIVVYSPYYFVGADAVLIYKKINSKWTQVGKYY